jgi:hypothetical protein
MKRIGMMLMILGLMVSPVVQSEEPAKPSVDQIVKDIAAIGPDALLARVKQTVWTDRPPRCVRR